MIGNPVSMPRVISLVEQYRKIAGENAVRVVEISEQEIMDSMLVANRNGHISCTQGGECLAGIRKAVAQGIVDSHRRAVLDATAHALKFAVFQEKYFLNTFEPEFEVVPKQELRNTPCTVTLPDSVPNPAKSRLQPGEFRQFVEHTSAEIAKLLGLKGL